MCNHMVNALDLLVGWLEKHNCDPSSKSAHDKRQMVLKHGWMNGERRFIPPRLTGFEEVVYNCWRIILSIKKYTIAGYN
jgi:hypothetical protein